MKKKLNNLGIATMEIIIAAVILAVVVIGVIIAIKMVSGKGGGDDVASADEQMADSLYKKVAEYIQNADLNVDYNPNQYYECYAICNKEKYQIIKFEPETGNVYVNEKAFSGKLSDNAKVTMTMRQKADASNEKIASKVSQFLMTIPDLTLDGAAIKLDVQVGDVHKSWSIPVNAELTRFKKQNAGMAVADPTPTPEQVVEADPTKAPDPTNTPTVAPTEAPKEDPTPEPTEKPSDEKTVVVLSKNNGENSLAVVKKAGENAIVRVTVVRTDVKDEVKEGWGIGGLCFEGWTLDPDYEIIVTNEMLVGKDETFSYDVSAKDIIDKCAEAGGSSFIANFYNGYRVKTVEVIY